MKRRRKIRPMKLFLAILCATTVVAYASRASAATYLIEGQIESSSVPAFPEGATYRYSFDYDSATVSGVPDGAAVERYDNALTNATLVIESPLGGITIYDLFNTRMMVVRTAVDHQLYLEFFGMSPDGGDPAFVYGLAAYYGETDIWTSNAPPAELGSQPWLGGEFWMEFKDSQGASHEVAGSTELPAAVPEPAFALFAASGVVGLLRRRRSAHSAAR